MEPEISYHRYLNPWGLVQRFQTSRAFLSVLLPFSVLVASGDSMDPLEAQSKELKRIPEYGHYSVHYFGAIYSMLWDIGPLLWAFRKSR